MNNWNTKDEQKLNEIVNTLNTFHINNADENVITDELGNEQSPDFTSSDYFIFPVEILMLLAIRKQVSLSTDIIKTPELMQLSINNLPGTVIPDLTSEDKNLITKCKTKLESDNQEPPKPQT